MSSLHVPNVARNRCTWFLSSLYIWFDLRVFLSSVSNHEWLVVFSGQPLRGRLRSYRYPERRALSMACFLSARPGILFDVCGKGESSPLPKNVRDRKMEPLVPLRRRLSSLVSPPKKRTSQRASLQLLLAVRPPQD